MTSSSRGCLQSSKVCGRFKSQLGLIRDGQDDIRWYEATRQSNGDYKVSVKASDHKKTLLVYPIHLYYIQNDGSRVGVGSTTTEVEFRNARGRRHKQGSRMSILVLEPIR